MKTLSEKQMAILRTAAARPTGEVFPAPASNGKALSGLIKRGLAQWSGQGQATITDLGKKLVTQSAQVENT